MTDRRLQLRSAATILVAALAWLGGPAAADPLVVGALEQLPGDAAVALSTEDQRRPMIAAGGPGALVVWEDTRTVLTGFTQTPFAPLMGNLQDIVAARIGEDGSVLDAAPILVSNRGRNQEKPEAAWNEAAGAWLVTWMSERPDWHYFDDVMAARVAADGTVLDPEPIPLRPETNSPSNDHAQTPAVASDGTEWLVVWQDVAWTGFDGRPNVTAQRVAADGLPLGPPVVLHQHPDVSFGPREPRVAYSDGVWLVTWTEASSNLVMAKRFDGSLTALDPSPLQVGGGIGWARTAGSDDGFMVVTGDYRAYRIPTSGAVLDPSGIDVEAGYPFGISGPEVAFDGLDWVVTYGATDTVHFQDDPDLYLARISTDGTLQSPGPGPALVGDQWEVTPVAAPGGAPGDVLLAFASYHPLEPRLDDIRTTTVDVAGAVGTVRDLGTGLPRQWAVRTTKGADGHVAVFLSERSGETRILAQRLDEAGTPVDPEPVEVAAFRESVKPYPDVAFDGTRYLVVWALDGTLWGRRLAADGSPVDPQPVAILVGDNAQAAYVGAQPGTFLVGWLHLFSGDLQTFRTMPVSAADLLPTAAPTTVGGDFSNRARIGALGGRFLALWQRQASHDQGPPNAYAAFLEADGTPSGGSFSVDDAGAAFDVELAIGDDRALAVWADGVGNDGVAVEGRMIGAGGGLLTGELLIADAAIDQRFPAAGWDGGNFVVAWTDYRTVDISLTSVEQLRGDVWARRVSADGSLLEPEGHQLSSGVLPETLPAVASEAGVSTVLFSMLGGVDGPEVQRLAMRRLTDPSLAGAGSLFSDGFESGDLSSWSTSAP